MKTNNCPACYECLGYDDEICTRCHCPIEVFSSKEDYEDYLKNVVSRFRQKWNAEQQREREQEKQDEANVLLSKEKNNKPVPVSNPPSQQLSNNATNPYNAAAEALSGMMAGAFAASVAYMSQPCHQRAKQNNGLCQVQPNMFGWLPFCSFRQGQLRQLGPPNQFGMVPLFPCNVCTKQ